MGGDGDVIVDDDLSGGACSLATTVDGDDGYGAACLSKGDGDAVCAFSLNDGSAFRYGPLVGLRALNGANSELGLAGLAGALRTGDRTRRLRSALHFYGEGCGVTGTACVDWGGREGA